MRNARSFFGVLVAGFSALFLGATAPAQGALLEIPVGYPQVVADPGVCAYDAGTSVLTLTGVPTFIYFDAAQTNVSFVDVGVVSISANIDNSGTLVGGTFTLTGEAVDWNTNDIFGSGSTLPAGTPLLTGTIVAYGIAAPGTSDLVDFRIQPTGGNLTTRFAPGDQIAVRVILEGSTFTGSFASSWNCARDKFIVGPTPPLVQESCAVTLTKTANPVTIGPISDKPGHDKSGDSDDDNHDNDQGY